MRDERAEMERDERAEMERDERAEMERDGRAEKDNLLINRDQRHHDHNPRWLSFSLLLHMGHYETTIRPLLRSRDERTGVFPPVRARVRLFSPPSASIVEKRFWIRRTNRRRRLFRVTGRRDQPPARAQAAHPAARPPRTARTTSSTSPCSRPWARRRRAAAPRVPREPPEEPRRPPREAA